MCLYVCVHMLIYTLRYTCVNTYTSYRARQACKCIPGDCEDYRDCEKVRENEIAHVREKEKETKRQIKSEKLKPHDNATIKYYSNYS